jgi:hypothetical protein
MLKSVLAGATALAIAGGTFAYAQSPGKHHPRGSHWKPTAEDIGAFGDARIAALKAGLKLTPDQEKLWPAFEQAMRDRAKSRADRFAARASADKPVTPIDRMKLRAERMTARGESLKKIADVAGPLYQSLDEAQKHRFQVLARLDGGGWRHGRHHHRHHHGPRGPMSGADGQQGPNTGPNAAPDRQ